MRKTLVALATILVSTPAAGAPIAATAQVSRPKPILYCMVIIDPDTGQARYYCVDSDGGGGSGPDPFPPVRPV
jgi:hypothetical protein